MIMGSHVVAAGTALLLLAGLTACGGKSSTSSPDASRETLDSLILGDSPNDADGPEPSIPATAAGAPSDTGEALRDVVPSWAGDYLMPPPLLVRGLNEAVLQPWTWGWTSPLMDSGEQESTVADGIPPDPLATVAHNGFVELVYPLPGWTFTARVGGSDSILPTEVATAGDAVVRIDLSGTADGSEIWIVGSASPGFYELHVSFTAVQRPTGVDVGSSDGEARAGEDASRLGEEIGFGSIGPQIELPQMWSIGTIYADLEPQVLFVDFAPPNQRCIAAQAKAEIGRGGAILVTLWIDEDRTDKPCLSSAEGNQIRIPLSEPLRDRRIYASTVPDTGGTSAAAERLADSIIGLDAAEATDTIRAEGFEVRDVTDLEVVQSDFNPNRINILISTGIVEFAAVY